MNQTGTQLNPELYEDFHGMTLPPKEMPKDGDGLYHFIFHALARYVKKGQDILDIGCGNGTNSFYCASKGANVLGIDLSSNAIAACKEGQRNLGFSDDKLSFKVMTLESLKKNQVFDGIILSEVLEHLPDDMKALQFLAKHLKPNGWIFISVPTSNAFGHKYKMRKYGNDAFDERVGHLRRYSRLDLEKALHTAGFNYSEYFIGEGPLRNALLTSETKSSWFFTLMHFKLRKPLEWLDAVLATIMGRSQLIVVAKKTI